MLLPCAVLAFHDFTIENGHAAPKHISIIVSRIFTIYLLPFTQQISQVDSQAVLHTRGKYYHMLWQSFLCTMGPILTSLLRRMTSGAALYALDQPQRDIQYPPDSTDPLQLSSPNYHTHRSGFDALAVSQMEYRAASAQPERSDKCHSQALPSLLQLKKW